jgi:membrane fusion protein (multidrug efflux system)
MKSSIAKSILLCGLVAVSANLPGCQKVKAAQAERKDQPADSAIVKVVAAVITAHSFEDWGSYSADLRGIDDATLTAPSMGGRVTMIKPVGTRVSAGEALCNIDGEKYEAALQAAKAQVELANGELERATANVEKGSLGRSVLDAANLAFQNARMMQATAQRAYEDCRCQAPFDGVLVSRSIERYQTVAPGMPTVRLSRIDRVEAVIAIPETDAFSYAEGMRTEFHLLQDPGRIYEGTLTSLDRVVDARSRTIAARLVIGNRDGSLKPGMVGRARILRKKYPSAIVIPSTALLRLQNGISAMVVENGAARQRLITVGATTDDSAMITRGLREGDRLIVSGAFQVSDGTRVTY